VLAIDPVPPPSERQKERGLQKKDFEAHYVWTRKGDEYHLCDFDRSRGHDPSWTVATAFRLARQWRVMRIVIDAVAYQRTLKWILDQEMRRHGIYYQVIPVADGMSKFNRIVGTIGSDPPTPESTTILMPLRWLYRNSTTRSYASMRLAKKSM
jgi:hypothetical protein